MNDQPNTSHCALAACSALEAAAEILETEANQLARLLDARQFNDLNYRVEIAVRSEMERLRGIATELRRNTPDEIDEPNNQVTNSGAQKS